MNILLFLTIIIALLLIIIILILYNGLKVSLITHKKEAELNYTLVLSILKIPVYKRSSDDREKEEEEENDEDGENKSKSLKERFEEIKPILEKLKESKNPLKTFIKHVLKTIDFKKIHGHLRLGLNDGILTVKIASWIWSIGAIVNTASNPTSLTVEPVFSEEVIDFDIEVELKINLLKVLIHGIILISKKDIRELIKLIREYKKNKEEEFKEETAHN